MKTHHVNPKKSKSIPPAELLRLIPELFEKVESNDIFATTYDIGIEIQKHTEDRVYTRAVGRALKELGFTEDVRSIEGRTQRGYYLKLK